MITSRREFLSSGIAASALAAVGLGSSTAAAVANTSTTTLLKHDEMKEGLVVGGLKNIPTADKKLKILILGGTGFLGPHIVQYADARGHEVTIFSRGRTNSHLFDDHEKLVGDRDPDKDAGLSALGNDRKWDAVIDTSSYFPRITRASVELLKDRVDFYNLITSISVYKDHATPNADESYPLGTIDDEAFEQITGESYGPLKALCEKVAEEVMPGRVSHVRPGLIVGPRDYSDRFTYWPVRVARGGEVMAPGKMSDPSQWIDARDLARFCVMTVEQKLAGPYNAAGPANASNIGELLLGAKAVIDTDATFTWVDADFLEENKIGAWMQMPVWVPGESAEMKGIMTANIDKAVKAGLTTRPVGEIVADTLAWWKTLPQEKQDRPMRAGISAAREAEVLKAWHEAQTKP